MKTVLECGAHNGRPNRLECHKLLKLGWNGVLLEPYEERFEELKKNHPNQLCLKIGLSDHCGTAILAEHRRKEGIRFHAQVITWDALVDHYDLSIDLAIIDVEHHELEVLAGMNDRLPTTLIIEMHVKGIHEVLVEKGYEFIEKRGVNGHYRLT